MTSQKALLSVSGATVDDIIINSSCFAAPQEGPVTKSRIVNIFSSDLL